MGIFAHELCNGDPPFIKESQSQIILNIVRMESPPIADKWSALFKDFVSSCLIKDPDQRPSAADLLQHEFLVGAENYKDEFA